MISSEQQKTKESALTWDDWLVTPPGQYILHWEQHQFDHAVVDAFGFQALQIGLPHLNCLKENRIPNQYLMLTPQDTTMRINEQRSMQICRGLVNELPFANNSLDLIALPHVLELIDNPHEALREIHRVLRPEGRLVISGFNPVSLWGARQYLSRLGMRDFLPREGQFINHLRIKDWLNLLDYSIDRGRFGCYRPPLSSQRGMQKMGFLEKAGDRWWPVLGSVFILSAVKRVSSLKWVGRIKNQTYSGRVTLSPATSKTQTKGSSTKITHDE